jgi:hypothetical protein
MGKLAGKTLLWRHRPRRDYTPQDWIQHFGDKHPNAKVSGDYIQVEAIVAGDNQEKGLSIVNIETGNELSCLITKHDVMWKGYYNYVNTHDVFDTDEANAACGVFQSGTDPHCPYK